MILAGQSLLSQIADMKRQAIVADFKALNHAVAEQRSLAGGQIVEGEGHLSQQNSMPKV